MKSHDPNESAAPVTLPAADQLRQRYDSLTPRQREVCHMMVAGLMSKQIADRLGASINTIKTHRTEIFRRMDAHSLVDLVRKIELVDRLPATLAAAAHPPADSMRQPLQLLVIEDHPVLRETMSNALERMGYGVFAAADGEDLEAILAAQRFDVVLLDIALGEGRADGLALAARLRQRARCGIVMTTATGDIDMRVRGYESGADAYLVKPINFQELDAVLQSLARRLPPN